MSLASDAAKGHIENLHKPVEIRFDVRGFPVPQGSAKAFPFRKKAVDENGFHKMGVAVNTVNPQLRSWREAIATEARNAQTKRFADEVTKDDMLLETPLAIDCTFRIMQPKARMKESWVRTRPDLDKLVRAVLDACTGVIWKDDSQVSYLSATKLYGIPGASIHICEL